MGRHEIPIAHGPGGLAAAREATSLHQEQLKGSTRMTEETIRIGGMTCGGCVASVKRALERLPLEREPEVEIGSARVEYDESELSHETIVGAIEDAGFDVKSEAEE
jgi:copper chaperone